MNLFAIIHSLPQRMQIKKLRFRSLCTVMISDLSTPNDTKPGDQGKKREIWGKSWRFIDGDAVHQNKFFFSLYHRFPPFWQSGQNLSSRDKLVKRTLFGICHDLSTVVIYGVSCQPVEQIWQIFLRTMHLYSIGAKKSMLQRKNQNIQWKYMPSACKSVYLESFWALSWDREISICNRMGPRAIKD